MTRRCALARVLLFFMPRVIHHAACTYDRGWRFLLLFCEKELLIMIVDKLLRPSAHYYLRSARPPQLGRFLGLCFQQRRCGFSVLYLTVSLLIYFGEFDNIYTIELQAMQTTLHESL